MGRKTFFDESLRVNMHTFDYYLKRLSEIAISRFEWLNLPDSVDARYIELSLFETGKCLYFNDEVVGNLALNFIPQSMFDVYGEPLLRRAYSRYNNYSNLLKKSNSVIIWNNYMRLPSYPAIRMFASKLYNLDRIIDVNSNAQKTPVLVQADDKQKLSMLNVYKEYDGNAPVIFGNKNFNSDSIKVLKTDAPYVSGEIYKLKTEIWNEALTYLGIPNETSVKKERMVKDEVARSLGGTIASRYSELAARKEAVKKINSMFGTNISVEYRIEGVV